MRQGLSSQPVSQHPNKTELELLFDPPGETECDFHIKYPYPDENLYLETYPYPGAYPGAYPEAYEVNDAYPGPSGYPYPGPEGYDSPYPESRIRHPDPDPGPSEYHANIENHDPANPHPEGYPSPDPRDGYPSPVAHPEYPYPEITGYPSPTTPGPAQVFANIQGYPSPPLHGYPSPGYPNFSYPSPGYLGCTPKSVRFPHGTTDIHPPSVDRPLTPYRPANGLYPSPAESSRGKYPLLTAESYAGKHQVLYTLEEQERLLYEGLCEQLLRKQYEDRAKTGGMSEEKRRSYMGIQSRDNFLPRVARDSHYSRVSCDENQQGCVSHDTFIHLPANTVYAQPMSRWSSASDGFVSRAHSPCEFDETRDRFASLQDSLQLAVDRGVTVGHDSQSQDVHYGSRDCVYYRIRHRVSSTASHFKRVFKRDDGEWRPKRFVSRLFGKAQTTKWMSLNDR